MRIDENGNVGIGTTSPGYNLEIKEGKVLLNNSNVWSDTDAANTKIYLGDTNFGVGSGHFSNYPTGEYTTLWSYNGAGRGIRFCATGAGTNKFSDYTTHMVIDGNTGNVGIGTTSIIQNVCALTVVGQTASPTTATMSFTSSQAIARFSGAQGQMLEIGAESGSAWDMWVQTHNTDPNGSNSRNLCLQPIQGRVGVGTMGPSYTLHVNGSFDQIQLLQII